MQRYGAILTGCVKTKKSAKIFRTFSISLQLILLCTLFFLAARHSANKFALAPLRQFSVFRFQFSAFKTTLSATLRR